MTAPLINKDGSTHRMDGTPNDARRPPKRFVIPCDISGFGIFRVVVVGPVNNQARTFKVDLIQSLDPGLPLASVRDWWKLRTAVYEGVAAEDYRAWGAHPSMVDLLP